MDVPHIVAGRFRIECEIGKGGMGTVYRATHLGLERAVAVKIIKPEFAADSDVADRFMREARTMAKLRHPHAAMIFDAGNLPDGRHFIVMEYVEGKTLSEALVQEGRFTPKRAVQIAADICDVLAEAHQLGIVHRDLKPSNIMLTERGVCVLDFGVAKVLATSADATATHATTGSGVIVGTPRYMSPEQCLGQRIGARSDLYSLGVLVYEMLTGHPPFTDILPSAVLVKQATAPPPPLMRLRADLPHPLAQAIHSLLAKQPDARPRTAAAARALLERSIVRAKPVDEAQPFSETVAAVGYRRNLLLRAVAPAVVFGALCFALLAWGSSGETAPQDKKRDAAPPPAANPAAALDSSSYGANPPVVVPQTVSLDTARRLVSAASHDPVGDVRIVQTPRGSALVALHDGRREGTSHLFVMEQKGGRYRVTSRAPLDSSDFRGAKWTAENVDADGDGYEEVIYTGTNARGQAVGSKLVLYVPRTRERYTLRLAGEEHNKKHVHAIWSANALTREAAPYRAALQQRIRTATF